uniref:Uncharacterized protein n=1 Tax=Rhizophora mucronata TaxID=61149 RepID=A0A2P2JX74_RHIMU
MCNKGSPAISSPGLKPTRKTRTKTRKPKYLSLKLELSPKKKKEANPEEPANNKVPYPDKQQLTINLFPLHPKNNLALQDRSSDMHNDHVAAAFFFQTATEDTSATLQDLLDTTASTTTTTTAATASDQGLLSPSLKYLSRRYDVRAAMRGKERDTSEERWVSYCEVVKTEQEEESGSCGGGSGGDGSGCGGDDASGNIMEGHDHGDQKSLVGLKLDYEDILNAWSDKGPLYIQGEFPQTVPDWHDASNVMILQALRFSFI